MATAPRTRFGPDFLRRLAALEVAARRRHRGRQRGERRSRKTGAGLEFADHRDYVPGDDVRNLDWNLYGRMDRLAIRLFDEDEDLSILIVVDASASMAAGEDAKFDRALQAAAALAFIATGSGALTANASASGGSDRVAVYLARDGIEVAMAPTRGRARFRDLLTRLDAAQAQGPTDLGAVARVLAGQHPRRGVVFLISDFYDPAGATLAIDRLALARFEPVVIQITGAADEHPSLHGDVTLVDAETGAERQVTVTPRLLEAYQRQYRALVGAVAGHARQRGIPCVQVTSDVPSDDLVLRLLRQRGAVR